MKKYILSIHNKDEGVDFIYEVNLKKLLLSISEKQRPDILEALRVKQDITLTSISSRDLKIAESREF